MNSEIEKLRKEYLPIPIKVLFIGESAPHGGGFFYKKSGLLHSQFCQVLKPYVGDQPSFVDAFKAAGIYLDDLVLTPVNHLSLSERRASHEASIPSMTERLRKYEAPCVVAFMKDIALPVAKAIIASGKPCRFEVVPFPGFGQQARFRASMIALLPEIL